MARCRKTGAHSKAHTLRADTSRRGDRDAAPELAPTRANSRGEPNRQRQGKSPPRAAFDATLPLGHRENPACFAYAHARAYDSTPKLLDRTTDGFRSIGPLLAGFRSAERPGGADRARERGRDEVIITPDVARLG
jgi:hypothetical protein